jgi:hypothetical protein
MHATGGHASRSHSLTDGWHQSIAEKAARSALAGQRFHAPWPPSCKPQASTSTFHSAADTSPNYALRLHSLLRPKHGLNNIVHLAVARAVNCCSSRVAKSSRDARESTSTRRSAMLRSASASRSCPRKQKETGNQMVHQQYHFRNQPHLRRTQGQSKPSR